MWQQRLSLSLTLEVENDPITKQSTVVLEGRVFHVHDSGKKVAAVGPILQTFLWSMLTIPQCSLQYLQSTHAFAKSREQLLRGEQDIIANIARSFRN